MGLPVHHRLLESGEHCRERGHMLPSHTSVIRLGSAPEGSRPTAQVPADVRVVKCTEGAEVDNAALTGESVPEPRMSTCARAAPRRTENSNGNPFESDIPILQEPDAGNGTTMWIRHVRTLGLAVSYLRWERVGRTPRRGRCSRRAAARRA